MTQPINTAWIWHSDDEIAGVRLDAAAQVLQWSVGIGCHCGQPDNVQPVATYRQRGVPGIIPLPPDDVTAEIDAALRQLNL